MESIARILLDPTWWFGIFVAILLGSALGNAWGWIRDHLLYPMLAVVSERFKKRRDERAKVVEAMIAALAANPEFMIVTFLRLLFQEVLWVGMWVLLALSIIVAGAHFENSVIGPLAILAQPTLDPGIVLLLTFSTSLYLGYMQYGLLTRAGRVFKAYDRYRLAWGLPSVFDRPKEKPP